MDKSWDEMTDEERHQHFERIERIAAAAPTQPAPVKKKGRGFIGKFREGVATADAQRALADGHTVFVMVTSNAIQWVSGSACRGVAEQIEAVEAVGRRLDHSAYVFDTLPASATRCEACTRFVEMSWHDG